MTADVKYAPEETGLRIYKAWISTWLSVLERDEVLRATLTLEELANIFKAENRNESLLLPDRLSQAVLSFRHHFKENLLALGGEVAPMCPVTNLLSEAYNPQTDCACNGLFPVPANMNIYKLFFQTKCKAIGNMLDAMQAVISRGGREWNDEDIFSANKLEKAVEEIVLCNTDVQPALTTCQGKLDAVLQVQAPSRRPSPMFDTPMEVYNELYPTEERVKLCADAKYFFVIACGASIVDKGLLLAIADAGNDILVADYCEATDQKTLSQLQRVGAGALAFLKLCNLAGLITDWQFSNFNAGIIQFRVLGHYRDHARDHLPGGIWGSRMTGLLAHRQIDIAIFNGVLPASLATGETLSVAKYSQLAEACILINDLIDLRSDTMRKTRENVILRGVRGNMCKYLDGLLARCLATVVGAVQSGHLSAVVVMSFCNWVMMSSHHKMYELITQVEEVNRYSICTYASSFEMSRYVQLLDALESYGSLSERNSPSVYKKRSEMDKLYYHMRETPQTHLAWLADTARSVLHPLNLRKIVDVVHFEWNGDIGDSEYCP